MKKGIHEVIFVGFTFVMAVALVAAAYTIAKYPESEFVSRVSVLHMDMSEYDSFEQATEELKKRENEYLTSQIKWQSDRGETSLHVIEMGADPQIDELQEYFSTFMESTTSFERLLVYVLGTGKSYPSITLDAVKLKEAFAESGIEQGNNNAYFSFQNGKAVIMPEQIGYGIDQEQVAAMLSEYWRENSVPESAVLPLRTSEPEYLSADLEPYLEIVQELSKKTISFQDEYGETWDLLLADHLDLLAPIDGEILIQEEAFDSYVDTELAEGVEQEPQSVVITETENQNYAFEGSARFGVSIDRAQLLSLANEQLFAEDTLIAIPTNKIEPEVLVPDSLKEKGVTELIGIGYTNFYGSPTNRRHNISVGMSKFNGIVIPQGEEFSFTSIMGPIDAEHGWKEELVIKGDETIPEYGGGLCQVSTTMFRAALYNGLPITLRKNHSYAVSYYAYPNGYGLDATVYEPMPDLRFINDTPADILIQGYTDGNSAYFVFYGTSDNRTVQMEGPFAYNYQKITQPVTIYTDQLAPGERKLEEYSHTGFDVDWYRTVTYADGTQSEREQIHSSYEARPEKWLEGKSATDQEG